MLVVLIIITVLLEMALAWLSHVLLLPEEHSVKRRYLIWLYVDGVLITLVPASLFVFGAVSQGWPPEMLWGIATGWGSFVVVGATVLFLHWHDGGRELDVQAETNRRLWEEIETLREQIRELQREETGE